MRIKDVGSRASDRLISLQNERLSYEALGNAKGKTFEDALSDSHQRALEEQLSALLEEIDEQGERLSRHLTIAELLNYKRLIMNFLNSAISNMYIVHRHNHFDQSGGHNIHCIVKTIDNRLEELTRQVLKDQQDRLTILGYIDDIKGLLMDIMT